jgi:hypothetical protein
VPRDLTPIRSEWQTYASRLRTRYEHMNEHYAEDRVRARLAAAVCDEVAASVEREEIIAGVLSTVLARVEP